jgi:hypothetical protein
MDQYLEDLSPDLRRLALVDRAIADTARMAWLHDHPSRTGRDAPGSKESDSASEWLADGQQ